MIFRRRDALLVASFLSVLFMCVPPNLSYAQNEPGAGAIINDRQDSLPQTIGIYRPAINNFYLSSDNTTGRAEFIISLGKLGMRFDDLPVVGDWNGDGIDTLGFYRPSTATFVLSDSTTAPQADYSFALGQDGDTPIAGDWDGDGRDGVGVFRPSVGIFYLKNELNAGFAEFEAVMGINGDVGLAGDWNGDGVDSPGIYRPSEGVFYLTDQVCNCSIFMDYMTPLGTADDQAFAGDWDADGHDGIGVYHATDGKIVLRNDVTTSSDADDDTLTGITNGIPLAGRWGEPISTTQ